MADAEAAVRQYLTYLEHPDQLLDPDEISRLEKAVTTAADPLSKLKAIGALETARRVDGTSFRAGFVRHARAWADQEGVPVSAFAQLGVSDEVLSEAGLVSGGGAAVRGRGRGRRRVGDRDDAPRQRAAPVPVENIKGLVPEGKFTVRQLEEVSGGSPATVRKALGELIEAGSVEELGAASDWTGRGRAPMVYQKLG